MTSCMIPRDIKILGNLKDLVGIKWRHKNSLFTPVKIMSMNYDVTDYTTAGEGGGIGFGHMAISATGQMSPRISVNH